ncbi:MAG: hypothetical protein HN366_15465 [Deltaproteobacteria bacterium]|jgi:hypothetical protein|nr:hypothetical protein [Deltaproteobacteria bacterium]
MSNPPRKCVVDTNVPKNANLAIDPGEIPDDLTMCVLACVEAVGYIIKKGGLVVDGGQEIFDEYRNNLSMSGQPGVGDRFMKWVHDNRWKFPQEDRVTITGHGDSYNEFPNHEGLSDFDISDRKFVAVANAHPTKPPIIQATDSKWWGWKDSLKEVGITVQFLCSDYVKAKYQEKMGT